MYSLISVIRKPSRFFSKKCSQSEIPIFLAPSPNLEELTRVTLFNKKELKGIYRWFKEKFPRKEMGRTQLREIMSTTFPNGDVENYSNLLFEKLDLNKDNTVTFDEFIRSYSVIARGKLEQKLEWLFEMFDLNKDHVITFKELYQVVLSVCQLTSKQQPLSDNGSVKEKAWNLLTKMDLDKDGILSKQDFIQSCLKDLNIRRNFEIVEFV